MPVKLEQLIERDGRELHGQKYKCSQSYAPERYLFTVLKGCGGIHDYVRNDLANGSCFHTGGNNARFGSDARSELREPPIFLSGAI